MSTTEYLAEVAQRAANATPGPWKIGHRANRVDADTHPSAIADCLFTHSDSTSRWLPTAEECQSNAAFIAAARSDVPKLLLIIAHQQETIDWLHHHQGYTLTEIAGKIAGRQLELDGIANEP